MTERASSSTIDFRVLSEVVFLMWLDESEGSDDFAEADAEEERGVEAELEEDLIVPDDSATRRRRQQRWWVTDEVAAEIERLVVRPAQRRRGAARF